MSPVILDYSQGGFIFVSYNINYGQMYQFLLVSLKISNFLTLLIIFSKTKFVTVNQQLTPANIKPRQFTEIFFFYFACCENIEYEDVLFLNGTGHCTIRQKMKVKQNIYL